MRTVLKPERWLIADSAAQPSVRGPHLRFSTRGDGHLRDMTTKSDYSHEEWTLLVEGPPLAAMHVIAAEAWRGAAEVSAIGRVYGDARQGDSALLGSTGLIHDIVEDPPRIDRTLGSPDAVNADAVRAGLRERLGQAISILQRKGTREELEDYRRFVSGLAQRVAAPPKEGGVFGTPGGHTSDAERIALDEIEDALHGDGT